MHETATLSAKPGSAPPATILIVDDEPEVRTVVAEFLEDFGYHVLQANGGAAGARPAAATTRRANC